MCDNGSLFLYIQVLEPFQPRDRILQVGHAEEGWTKIVYETSSWSGLHALVLIVAQVVGVVRI